MQRNAVKWRRLCVAAGLAVILLAALAAPAAAGPTTPGVIPPQARPHGHSYAEWSARWWQWAFSLPADQNPLLDETGCANGANGQSGSVWFLAGVFNASGVATRDCTIPPGKALFFPIINVECSTVEADPFYGSNEAELRACATKDQFALGELAATIDGVPVPNLGRYRAVSPLFAFTLPDNNVLGVPAGAGQSVSNGYYLMLAPLSVGSHVIHFQGSYTAMDFALDITYNLTVQP